MDSLYTLRIFILRKIKYEWWTYLWHKYVISGRNRINRCQHIPRVSLILTQPMSMAEVDILPEKELLHHLHDLKLEHLRKTRIFKVEESLVLSGRSLHGQEKFGSWCSPSIWCVCMHMHSVMSNSLQPHELWPTRLLSPWNFPGKNTEVGCHCLLHRISLEKV